jgi:glycosyltransferase involved in cell wall biosynthesis
VDAPTPGRPAGVRWVSDLPGDGFGNAAIGYLRALEGAGVPVTWTPLAWRMGRQRVAERYRGPAADLAHRRLDGGYDTLVVHLVLGDHRRWLDEADGRRTALCTTWESDRLPRGWAEALEEVDAVIVPSRFNRDSYVRSVGREGVAVVPHCARTVEGTAPMVVDRIGDRFTFYTIGAWNTRKAVPATINAFLDAFTPSDDVALIVKTSREDYAALARRRRGLAPGGPPGWETATWPAVADLLGRRAGGPIPPVHLIADHLPASDIDALHARGDCFVSLARSEGWGLCIADALLFGNPVVVTGYGGQLDYLGATYPLLVDYDLVPTMSDPEDDCFEFADGYHWARARHDHAVDLLRWVYDHPDEARGTATGVGRRLAETCSPANVGARLRDGLTSG